MLSMIFFFNPFFNGVYWKLSINLLFMSFIIMKFTMSDFLNTISYSMGVDFLSLMMIFLTLFIFSLSVLSSKQFIDKNKLFFFIFILMKILFLTFSTYNFLYFYMFFEMSIIPMLFIILGWGLKVERLQAGIYFLFYTLFSSLPLLLCIMISFFNTCSLYMSLFYMTKMNCFFLFFFSFAFLVKMPMFLFHLWLPKAHVEAPLLGSMILAGVLLKLGSYGLIRMMNFLNEKFFMYSVMFVSFNLWGGVIVSSTCLNQIDLKVIVAFSSVSHMSMMIGGLYSLNKLGLNGSLLMMISHGLTSSGMFFLVNVFYERTHSRSMIKNKGLMNISKNMSLISFLIISASMGTPPSINLMSELIICFSLFYFWLNFFLLGLILMLSILYSLYMYSNSQHGKLYSGMFFYKEIFMVEYFILFMHWIPSNLLILKADLLMCYM